jgi:hypothetical protein
MTNKATDTVPTDALGATLDTLKRKVSFLTDKWENHNGGARVRQRIEDFLWVIDLIELNGATLPACSKSKEFNLSSEQDYTHPLLVGVKPGDDLGPEYASADESYETIDPPRNYSSLGPFASLLRTP